MVTEKFANNPITTLNGGINSIVTSLSVANASEFPAQPQFRIKVEQEYMLVTGVSGTTFTVSRGAEGSSNVSHSNGVGVTHILTAGALAQLKLDAGGSGPKSLYLPLVSGFQSVGSTYTLIGVLPSLDYSTLGVGTVVFSFTAIINIPASSTARVRLYDVTNSNTIFESSVISGLQVEHDAGTSPITLASGSSMLEFWLSTPTNTGGNASCLAAGILATFS